MSDIIPFFQKLIKGGVGIRAGGLENFSKINERGGGTIIWYSRVQYDIKQNSLTLLVCDLEI